MRPSSLGGGRILRRTLSVCPSVCPSRYRSFRQPLASRMYCPASVTSRHLANYNDTDVLFGTHWAPHIVRPSRPHKFLSEPIYDKILLKLQNIILFWLRITHHIDTLKLLYMNWTANDISHFYLRTPDNKSYRTWKELVSKLESTKGKKKVYGVAKQVAKSRRNVVCVNCV